MKILLKKSLNKHSNNTDSYISLELNGNQKLLPKDEISDTIDEYEQYLSEKDSSSVYRFVFTINPVCTNVLFNNITEIVKDEGSDKCIFYGVNGPSKLDVYSIDPDINDYLIYKNLLYNNNTLNRLTMIRDTAFSHPKIGNVVYHCGMDIFNNHILRAKDFSIVNKLNEQSKYKCGKMFNTIEDYARNNNGDVIKDYNIYSNLNKQEIRELKLYNFDNIYSFSKSISNNLIEKDGWLGFMNKSKLGIVNYSNISINKCMNNNKPCEMIDMYPDRSLFSFVPKYNKYRNRAEKNWDYCLTYPYSNYYNNVVEKQGINGLLCKLITNINDNAISSNKLIIFRTDINNNFKVGDEISFTIIYNEKSFLTIPNTINIESSILETSKKSYYFTIRYDAIEEYIDDIKNYEIRVRKIINDTECEYYYRVFKRIPNFKNTNVYDDEKITNDEIELNCLNNFNGDINKLAFERTIYNDQSAQIVINDDISVKGLKDNLGREISEIYLTLIKCNKGYKLWYNKKPTYASSEIEYSHCFGKITSGLDLPNYIDDYNVHKIHNINVQDEQVYKSTECMGLKESPLNLENNNGEITIEGDTLFKGKGEFLGDIVEFSPSELKETTLEEVNFRFNTAQREFSDLSYTKTKSNTYVVSGEYANLFYDSIKYDFYEINESSDDLFIETKKYNQSVTYNLDGSEKEIKYFPSNINPEGYYYKPHYKIILKEFDDDINEGFDTLLNFTVGNILTLNDYTEIFINTAKDYYLNVGDIILLFDRTIKKDKTPKRGVVISVDKKTCQFCIRIPKNINTLNKILQYRFYKRNEEIPENAYLIGNGEYRWLETKKEIDITTDSELYDSMFTNGAHYFNKVFNFFLRRQDPIEEFQIRDYNKANYRSLSLSIAGQKKDVTKYESESNTNDTLC